MDAREQEHSVDLPAESSGSPRRRGWLWLLVLTVVCAGGYYMWSKKPAQADASAAATKGSRARRGSMVPVLTAKSLKGNIDVFLDGLGAVTPINTVTVKSRVEGELLAIHYREGEMVQKGAALAEIDPRPYQVQLTQAEGQLARDQALLANAKTDLARYETLIRQKAVSEQQLVTQKALIGQYEGTVKIDQGTVDSAKLNIAYSHIKAPISGRVGLRLVDPGNIVHTSDSTGLLVITQVQPISVIFTLAEDQLPAVVRKTRVGARLRVDAYDRDNKVKLGSGTLTTIDNQIDQTTGTLKLRAVFDNRRGELFPNQFVNARLLVEEKRGVVLVPTAAVQRNTDMDYIWTLKPDSTVAVRKVQTGVTEGPNTEIVSGLEPDATVIMAGVDKLQEGAKVRAGTEGRAESGGSRSSAGERGKGRRKQAQ